MVLLKLCSEPQPFRTAALPTAADHSVDFPLVRQPIATGERSVPANPQSNHLSCCESTRLIKSLDTAADQSHMKAKLADFNACTRLKKLIILAQTYFLYFFLFHSLFLFGLILLPIVDHCLLCCYVCYSSLKNKLQIPKNTN